MSATRSRRGWRGLFALVLRSAAIALILQIWVLPLHEAHAACQFPLPASNMGALYRPIGAATLRCPTSPLNKVPGSNGRVMAFENGAMAESAIWPRSVQAAYAEGDSLVVMWTDTSPFNYDFFIVRYDGQQRDVRNVPRSEGTYVIHGLPNGTYRIIIEGCDSGGIGSSKCRQGWTTPMTVQVT